MLPPDTFLQLISGPFVVVMASPPLTFINSVEAHTNTHKDTHTHAEICFHPFSLFLSPLQWFFSCMTEIGVNQQQGWAEGAGRAVMKIGGQKLALSHPLLSLSLSLHLYPYLFAVPF